MGFGIVFVGDQVTILGAELGVLDSYSGVDCRVPPIVGGIVAECTECESILVQGARVADQPGHVCSSPNVMKQVGELVIAEWIVSEVLDDRSSIRVSMSLLDFFIGRVGEPFDQRGPDVGNIGNVDQFLMRKDGIAFQGLRGENDEQKADGTES